MESPYDTLVLAPLDIKEGRNRKIYTGVEFEEYERNWIEGIKAIIQNKGIVFPDWIDDTLLLKGMESAKGKATKAIEMLTAFVSWRTMELPIAYESVQDILAMNLAYSFGMDNKMRPIIIVNVRRVVDAKINPDQLIRMAYFMLNHTMEQKFVRGKVETWDVIFDLHHVGTTALPTKQLKLLAKKMSANYPSCLHRMFVINSPSMINFLWGVVKNFLEKDTVTKIQIFGANNWQVPLQALVSPAQLEAKYGGTNPDVVSSLG